MCCDRCLHLIDVWWWWWTAKIDVYRLWLEEMYFSYKVFTKVDDVPTTIQVHGYNLHTLLQGTLRVWHIIRSKAWSEERIFCLTLRDHICCWTNTLSDREKNLLISIGRELSPLARRPFYISQQFHILFVMMGNYHSRGDGEKKKRKQRRLTFIAT
jgi:hypothetical protein